MYIICFYPAYGSRLYYSRKLANGDVRLCACKLSARRYKTFKGALHALIDLSDYLKCDVADFDVIDISDLVKYA